MSVTPNEAGTQDLPVVAIIGAGQLGYLLCEAARNCGIQTLVISDADAPALQIADDTIVSDYEAPGLAAEIAARAGVVTFEFEAVPDSLLEALTQESIEVRPSVEVLRLIKNKARQKAWMVEAGFPTARHIELTEAEVVSREFLSDIAPPFVQKAQEGGYDGYGVQIIHNESELDKLWPVPSIIERFLDKPRELGVVVARSADGSAEVFPTVELLVDQERNILDMVVAPAPISAELAAEAEALSHDVIERLNSVGVFAVELFLVGESEILVNEISPRVHNSGHHTIESCTASQFEQHMRAVAGLPLKPAELLKPAVMQNVLCNADVEHLVGRDPGLVAVANESVTIHWYGKKEAREGRKMGHITCVGVEPEQGRAFINETLSGLKQQAG